MPFKPHQSLKIKTGKFAGLTGTVMECNEDEQKVLLEIKGVSNDVSIDETRWFNFQQVEL